MWQILNCALFMMKIKQVVSIQVFPIRVHRYIEISDEWCIMELIAREK